MKALVVAGIAVSTLMLGSTLPAQASGGCGPFAHRGYYGYCRPNGPGYGAYGYGYGRPYGFARPYGYGWHRPFGYGYGYRHYW